MFFWATAQRIVLALVNSGHQLGILIRRLLATSVYEVRHLLGAVITESELRVP